MIELTYYVCGTPSNKGGFQYSTSNGHALPGEPGTYLDRVPNDKLKEGDYRRIERFTHHDILYTSFTWYKTIEPNDTEYNRGAYIGVGCLTSQPLEPAQSVAIATIIDLIQFYLAGQRDHRNRFLPDFSMDSIPWESFSENNFILRDAEIQHLASTGRPPFDHHRLLEFHGAEFYDSAGSVFLQYERQWRKSENNKVLLAQKIEQLNEENIKLQRKAKELREKRKRETSKLDTSSHRDSLFKTQGKVEFNSPNSPPSQKQRFHCHDSKKRHPRFKNTILKPAAALIILATASASVYFLESQYFFFNISEFNPDSTRDKLAKSPMTDAALEEMDIDDFPVHTLDSHGDELHRPTSGFQEQLDIVEKRKRLISDPDFN